MSCPESNSSIISLLHFVQKMSDSSEDNVPWRFASARMSIGDDSDYFWKSFKQAKYEVNHYFAHYRRGYRSADQPWKYAKAAQDPGSRLFRHAKQFRRIRGSWENIYQVAPPRRAGGMIAFNRIRISSPQRTDGEFGVNRMQDIFDHNRVPFRALKLLGAGGNGVAILCDTHDPDLGVEIRRRFVVKVVLRGEDSMEEEKGHMMVRMKVNCFGLSQPPCKPGLATMKTDLGS